MKTRRKYDREFKQMVVELSNNRDDLSVLASELDTRAELIYRWRRASFNIMLNIAEGTSRFSNKDRKNFMVVARGSAYVCAAILNYFF